MRGAFRRSAPPFSRVSLAESVVHRCASEMPGCAPLACDRGKEEWRSTRRQPTPGVLRAIWRAGAALVGADPDTTALRGGIVVGAEQVDGLIRFVAENPAVMTGWDGKRVPGRDDELLAIGHDHGRPAGHH